MKYNVLDFISCPADRHFPLKLYAIEIKDDTTTYQRPYVCEQYCGYRNRMIADAVPSDLDCERCYSKTVGEGVLFCEQCGALYLVTKGIPKLIPEELKSQEEIQLLEETRSQLGLKGDIDTEREVDSFILKAKRNEMISRGKYDKEEIIASYALKRYDFINRIQYEAAARNLNIKNSDTVLDAGAGYGTCSIPISQNCRYIVSTDITFEVLLAFREFYYGISTSFSKGYEQFPEDKICLIQADMCLPPFRKGFHFNKAISTQVVCHIPGEKERESFIKSISDHLEPGGIFVLTAFNYSLFRRLLRLIKKTPKEAVLEPTEWTGYYYRFTKDEFRELLSTRFAAERVFGFQGLITRYLALMSSGVANILERMMQALPASHLAGEIILAKCHKRV